MSDGELRQPRALLLDIDNTVYPYAPCHAAGIRSAYRRSVEFGLWNGETAFSDQYAKARRRVKSRLGLNAAAHSRLLYFKEMIEERSGFTDFDRVQCMETAYWDGYRSGLIPDTGCLEFLEDAAARGIGLAWISNFTTQRQIWKLRTLGLDRVRSVLVTSEEAGADKPDPAILELALDRLGIADHAAWIIGDEPADIQAARARKLPILIMRRQLCETGDSGNAGEHVVNSWAEIAEVLRHARN